MIGAEIFGIVQILFADIILSGDNALVIGMAAASLSPQLRKRAIFWGMALAAILRIFFAAIATYLIAIPGVLFVGGLLLAWVCWRFYGELRDQVPEQAEQALGTHSANGSPRRQLWNALVTITIADVSMSIDNIVAVAAIARDNTTMLVFGLVLAIAFMAFAATLIMRILSRYPWLSYAGLLFLIYLAVAMLIDGTPQVLQLAGFKGASP